MYPLTLKSYLLQKKRYSCIREQLKYVVASCLIGSISYNMIQNHLPLTNLDLSCKGKLRREVSHGEWEHHCVPKTNILNEMEHSFKRCFYSVMYLIHFIYLFSKHHLKHIFLYNLILKLATSEKIVWSKNLLIVTNKIGIVF